MREITEHKAYELLENKYERVCLDYVIFYEGKANEGLATHQKAIVEAFKVLRQRFSCYDALYVKTDKMLATHSSINELLQTPPDDYCNKKLNKDRSFTPPTPIPYWFAFLEPPHGTPYLKEDFIAFNEILFPNKNDVEAYRWNDDFSNYFDAGKEWWGTGLWTVFDKNTKLIVVIGASLTD